MNETVAYHISKIVAALLRPDFLPRKLIVEKTENTGYHMFADYNKVYFCDNQKGYRVDFPIDDYLTWVEFFLAIAPLADWKIDYE